MPGPLAVDDLHWADPGTIDVLELLVGHLPLLAAARSSDPATGGLVERLTAAGFECLRVGPLGPEDAAAIVRHHRTDLGPTAVRRIVRRCGGVPLLLAELAAGDAEVSESLRLSIDTRVASLSTTAARLLGLVALAGRPLSAASLSGDDVRQLTDLGLVRETAEGIEVSHAVLAEHVTARLDADSRRDLHRELAVLAGSAGEAARHHEAAGDLAQARAAALEAAANAEDRPVELAAHLAVAARCSGDSEADSLRLRAAWALALAM